MVGSSVQDGRAGGQPTDSVRTTQGEEESAAAQDRNSSAARRQAPATALSLSWPSSTRRCRIARRTLECGGDFCDAIARGVERDGKLILHGYERRREDTLRII